MPGNNSNDGSPSAVDKCMLSTGLCCFKAQSNTKMQVLEFQIKQRQKKFGIDYMTLVENGASEQTLKSCLKQAQDEIAELQREIDELDSEIGNKERETKEKMNESGGGGSSSTRPNNSGRRPNTGGGGGSSIRPSNGGGGSNKKKPNVTKPGGKGGRASALPPGKRDPITGKPEITRKTDGKISKSAADQKHNATVEAERKKTDPTDWPGDPKKWKLREHKFSGSTSYIDIGKQEDLKGKSISAGINNFKGNPLKYYAMMYQTSMLDWPANKQDYKYVHRAGTSGFQPKGVSPKGWMTILINEYERCTPFKDNVLPKQYRDKYTDSMSYQGRKLHSAKNKPIMPGRGMGMGDDPNLKIIGDIDPSDIAQGSVGNCWLLSAISALAEFDGAVKRLFRKTKNLDKMPLDKPNMYTITLYDLPTWREVDIQIDERLCVKADGSGQLLGAAISEDSELWVCYLEKALAAHCGGWDKIKGGQCTHAWAMLTGCKEQYTIRKNKSTGKYACYGRYNPFEKKWSKHTNSPHDSDSSVYQMPWPKVGGGGDETLELDEEELFMRMCAWDDENYIVGAGTSGTSDKNSTDGMVDNHAYSVITSLNDVAGTDIDLIKVRNPWGRGEIEDGEFDDDGPGWDQYPQIKKELNPVVADDGIFWVTKQEFFQYYQTIYLSASNMTEFLED